MSRAGWGFHWIESLLWIAHALCIRCTFLSPFCKSQVLPRCFKGVWACRLTCTKFHHKQRGCKHEDFLRHKSIGQKLHHSQCRTWFDASSLKQSRRSNRPEERRLRWSEPIQTKSSKKLSTDCHGVEARTDIGHLITVLGFLGQAFFTPSKPLVTSS